jgi:malonyl-CoA O-methyltransferase
MQTIDKARVRKKFLEALHSYDDHASVQRLMGLELVRELNNCSPEKFGTVLEIGSGTGKLTKYLSREIRFNTIFCNDLFEEAYPYIVKWCKKENFLVCDGEDVSKLPGNIDLLVSNATFQWFDDLPEFLHSVRSRLNDNAIAAFTTFGPSQFKETKEITGKCLEYVVRKDLEEQIQDKYKVLYFNEWEETLKFASVKRLLKHISSTGVSGVSSSLPSMDFETFQTKYKEKFFDGEMYSLTYHPQIWILKAL